MKVLSLTSENIKEPICFLVHTPTEYNPTISYWFSKGHILWAVRYLLHYVYIKSNNDHKHRVRDLHHIVTLPIFCPDNFVELKTTSQMDMIVMLLELLLLFLYAIKFQLMSVLYIIPGE